MKQRSRIFSALTAAAMALTALVTTLPAAAETPAEPIRVMCLGDSITDGFWLTGGYRNTLCQRITDAGQEASFDFVGPNWGGNGYDPQHAGYSGYAVDNIPQEESISGARTGVSSFADWLLETYPADVVLLQLGTNDILSNYALDSYGSRIDALAQTVLDSGATLYLATLPPMDATNTLYINGSVFTVDSMDACVNACNEAIRGIVSTRQANGDDIYLAEIAGVVTKQTLYDGVHPSEQGYADMGNFWYERLAEQLALRSGDAPKETTTTSESTTETTTSDTIEIPLLPGDVTRDGKVDIADVVLLARVLVNAATLPDSVAATQGNLDIDGDLDAFDLAALCRLVEE